MTLEITLEMTLEMTLEITLEITPVSYRRWAHLERGLP
jgi:hypothetical protein